ncbi:ABC transporter ATP-binding protein [Limimaricola litoreus]|uniref:ABC transporter ATP-binding protein n=1 Tax=Limimaricola litoreus TaxID=2955316 RepID=A0A9X2JPF1_9RHOB|nr:ABC transporter ATP-binding protein [Limimaricola litoreus]MCP1169513.1 ABC transporter ATP-binding protein [Limimaricola litoreus]
MTRNTALSIRDLSISYDTPEGRLRAIREVSFDVARGGITGLVGESGCGKSTLMSAILGLLDGAAIVESGEIWLGETDLLTLSRGEMRRLLGDRIGAVFQDPMRSLNPVLTIGRQMTDIQFRHRLSRRTKRERAIEMLHKVRIPDPAARLDRYPHELSGGMRQRVAIAMALMAEPDLLVADEPTTALDATLEMRTIELLRELQQEIGCAIVFITHHLGVVSELCDDTVIMYAGEVVEAGPTRALFEAPRHPYTDLLFACDPARIRERSRHLPTIPGTVPGLIDVPPGCVFAERCPERFAPCGRLHPRPLRVRGSEAVRCHLHDPEVTS